jgi:class 3 adenylate cyclase
VDVEIVARVERRRKWTTILIVALHTDVRLNIIEPGIALHGARIVKHTGDGFLAEFPSATRAVWFAKPADK